VKESLFLFVSLFVCLFFFLAPLLDLCSISTQPLCYLSVGTWSRSGSRHEGVCWEQPRSLDVSNTKKHFVSIIQIVIHGPSRLCRYMQTVARTLNCYDSELKIDSVEDEEVDFSVNRLKATLFFHFVLI
jgi:hypothetical protein